MHSSLSIDVFNSGYKPVPGGPGWDDSTPPPGRQHLDADLRRPRRLPRRRTAHHDEGQQLAGWVQNAGKQLSAIFVTHGHADHFFGAGPCSTPSPTPS